MATLTTRAAPVNLQPLASEAALALRLSVLLPIYNEERELEACLKQVLASPIPTQIIAVDDCSSDATPQILAKFTDPRLCVIRHPQNRGKGSAIQTALQHASGDVVIIQDADTEYDPRDYAPLLNALGERQTRDPRHPYVVYGARDLSTQPLVGRLGNIFLTLATNLLCGTRLRDMETCYKLVPTALMRDLNIQSRGFEVEPEITAKLARRGVRFAHVPVSYHPRTEKKLRRVRDGVKSLVAIFKYRFADAS
jgi:glycosyltransferase involved in cell wall biosynthesis